MKTEEEHPKRLIYLEKSPKRLRYLENQGANCSPHSLPELATSPTILSSDRQNLGKFTKCFRPLPVPSVLSFSNPLPDIGSFVRRARDDLWDLRCP